MGTANPVGSDGPVVTGSPIGPCETLSPLFQSALELLEHSVPEVILERSSRKKLSAPEPLEYSVPDEILERSSRRKFSALAGGGRWGGGGSSSVGTANPVGSDGPVVTCSPIGPCETLSHFFQSDLEPLEHSVPDVGLECSSRRKLSTLDPLEHSGLDQAGPVDRHVGEGPAGPKKTLLDLDPLEHSGLDRADPAGRHATGHNQPGMVDQWRGSQFWDQ